MIQINKVSFHEILPSDWNHLVDASPYASFFQTHAWVKLWLEHFGSTLSHHLIISVHDDETLIGIGAFGIRNQEIHFLTLSPVLDEEQTLADYGDILAARGKESIVWHAVFETLNTYCLQHNYTLKLEHIRPHSVTHAFFEKPVFGKWLGIENETTPLIRLPATWALYLSNLSSRARHEIKRKLNRAKSHDLTCQIIQTIQTDHYQGLLDSASSEKQRFFSPPMVRFFNELMQLPCVNVMGVFDDQKMIGMLILMVEKNSILAYNTLYDANYYSLSPGIILFSHAIQYAIETSVECFNFLRGQEPYKYQLGGQDQPLYQIIRT